MHAIPMIATSPRSTAPPDCAFPEFIGQTLRSMTPRETIQSLAAGRLAPFQDAQHAAIGSEEEQVGMDDVPPGARPYVNLAIDLGRRRGVEWPIGLDTGREGRLIQVFPRPENEELKPTVYHNRVDDPLAFWGSGYAPLG